MSVATKAQAEGDGELAELGWLQALSLMNHMAEEVAAHHTHADDSEQTFKKWATSRAH